MAEHIVDLSQSPPVVTIDHCRTVAELFHNRVQQHPDKVALREKDFGLWNEYSWSQYGDYARLTGLGLIALGLERGDVCSVASEVCREWLFADQGIISVGGVTNGVYPTDAPDQVKYLITDSGTRFYFAEDEEQLDKVLQVRQHTPTLEKIIIFDMEGLRHLDDSMCMSFDALLESGRHFAREHPEVWEREIHAADPEDLMVLTYTSGTTGPPKGAMISHRNMMYMMVTLQRCYNVSDQDEQLAFLPLAHVAGRMFYISLVLESCSVINLVEDAETMIQDLQEISPTLHFAVPRVWEKQFSTVAIMLKEGTVLGRFAYECAIAIGENVASFRLQGKSVPLVQRLLFFLAEHIVLKNIRRMLGINNCRILSTAAAPVAPELIKWFWSLGKPMYEVYGQTECTGLATSNRPEALRIGSVGKSTEDAEIELSAENEIKIRSPGVITGYWNKPEKTADTIRQDWLYTGDVGRLDEDGFVYIIDRINDIIITSGGKNITPSEIENQLKFSPFISDAVIVGDKRPYLTCLVMIDHENVTKFAQDNDLPFTSYTSLCHTTEIQDLVWQEIEKVNQKFARVETIKKFSLIDQLLDPEDEELTPTMKLKRKVVNEKYADMVNRMYQPDRTAT